MANATTSNENLKTLLLHGIEAVQGAGAVGSNAAERIEGRASSSDLKSELGHGSEMAERWRSRIADAQRAAGGNGASSSSNAIMEAIYQTGEKTAQQAPDDVSRDLGIVAIGQIALHYYIAAFGTLRAYAEKVGLRDVAESMQQCLNEAKAEDQHHTELAAQLAGR